MLKKRLSSILLSFALIMGMVPTQIIASETVPVLTKEEVAPQRIEGNEELQFDVVYEEVVDDDHNTNEDTYSSEVMDHNCRKLQIPSDGRLILNDLNGSSNQQMHIYNAYGARFYLRNMGKSHYIHLYKGTYYIKIWHMVIGSYTLNYSFSFEPNHLYKTTNGSLAFDKENIEYIRDCSMESAFSSDITEKNCRKITFPSDGKVTFSAYGIGSGPDVRLMLYDSYGSSYLSNVVVTNGVCTYSADVKKGDAYLKFWECSGENTEFHYTITFDSSGQESEDPQDVKMVLNKETLSLEEGQSEQLKVGFTPVSAGYSTVTWKSNNENVATVSDGLVFAIGEGSAVITATTTDGKYYASCAVTVTKKSPEVEKKETTITTYPTSVDYTGDRVLIPRESFVVNGSTGKVLAKFYDSGKSEIDAPTDSGEYLYRIHVAADEQYEEAWSDYTTLIINKAANTLKVDNSTLSIKEKTLKKTRYYDAEDVLNIDGGIGEVIYKKTSGNKKITISSDGVLKIKKGLKKGTYKVVMKVMAEGDKNHNSGEEIVTLKVKVKK